MDDDDGRRMDAISWLYYMYKLIWSAFDSGEQKKNKDTDFMRKGPLFDIQTKPSCLRFLPEVHILFTLQ